MEADAGQLECLYCTGANQERKVAEVYTIVHAEVGEIVGIGSSGLLHQQGARISVIIMERGSVGTADLCSFSERGQT